MLFSSLPADDDLITIFDSSDLSFAIQCSRILKLTLFGKILSYTYINIPSYYRPTCCCAKHAILE